MITVREPRWDQLPVEGSWSHADGRGESQVVGHDDLLQAVCNELAARRIDWNDVRQRTTRNGRDAVMSVGLKAAGTWFPCLGIDNRNDMRHRVRYYAGAVFDDWFGGNAVVDEFRSGQIKQGLLSLQKEAEFAVNGLVRRLPAIRGEVARLRKTRVDDDQFRRCLFAVGRDAIMPWSRVGRIDGTWDKIEPEKHTALTLVRLFGHVAGMNPPERQMGQCLRFYRIIEQEFFPNED